MNYNISALYTHPTSDYYFVVFTARSLKRSPIQIDTNQYVSPAKSPVISETYGGDNMLNWFNMTIN
jgi:hypothetical protein